MRPIRGFSATRQLLSVGLAASSAAPRQVPMTAPSSQARIERDVYPCPGALMLRSVRLANHRRNP